MKKQESLQTSRRKFLGRVGAAGAATLAAGVVGVEPLLQPGSTSAQAASAGPENTGQRRTQAKQLRDRATQDEFSLSPQGHPDNGDEARYPNRIGNFSKTLRHDPLTGEVESSAYNALIAAISSGNDADFDALAISGYFGCPDQSRQRRLVNPMAGYAFDLQGADSHAPAIRPAPAFASAEEAGEMAELYWMALLRDVNFEDYATNSLALAAAADLSNMSDFRGPKQSGHVTPQTLFRDRFPGCTYWPIHLAIPAAAGELRRAAGGPAY